MNQTRRLIMMLSVAAMTWLLLAAVFGAAYAAPVGSSEPGVAQRERANPTILPPSQAATVTVAVDTSQQGQTGGATATTTRRQTTTAGLR